ncbi:MAG: bifunctional folylpolyglutamate synthase/dihydrofolate synthase [Bacteroidales bacterium]|nr:bifunctional folylpolyglutamate synthase/dihydrofolate synthase [Bacteroidales bacterium]
MTYNETLQFLFNSLPVYQRIGAAAYKSNLNNTIALMEALGHPERAFKSIHVAGTNGKGSVSHTLASIAQESGYKTGLYTSPHLKDFRERIRINGNKISKQYVVSFVQQYKELFSEIQPSFFEMTVAMAFSYFAQQDIDIAIIEVGMGGRLDSTNVLTPILSIITNISFDHTQFLGNTLPAIAKEKAGIIKPYIPVVIGETQEQTQHVFEQIAGEKHAPICFADKTYQLQQLKISLQNNEFHLQCDACEGNKIIYKNIDSPLAGLCQEKNIKTILTACKIAGTDMFPQKAVQNGIARCISNTHLMGRWQILQTEPLVITDTGHNEAGIQLICRQLKQISYQNLHIVLGVVNDKDLSHILPYLPQKARYYFCKADIPRGKDAKELQAEAARYQLHGKHYVSVKSALRAAKRHAQPQDVIFVGGSTFTVAEVI